VDDSRWDEVDVARPQRPGLRAEDKLAGPLDDKPCLLLIVRVRRRPAVRLDGDVGQEQGGADDRPEDHTGLGLDRRALMDVGEHARLGGLDRGSAEVLHGRTIACRASAIPAASRPSTDAGGKEEHTLTRSRRLLATGLGLAAALTVNSTGARADSGSLYHGTGPRPGPDILYAPLAQAPQLSNAGVWKAPPILVSGASAYRGGEYLYQDFLYDDHGANGQQADPNDPRRDPGGNSADGDLFSRPNGTYTYPTSAVYANNAADLVELRVKPLAGSTAFRITLNTLQDASLVATTIVIGGTGAPVPLPHGANTRAPGQLFLTVHGSTADLLDAAGVAVGKAAPAVQVDTLRRQIQVLVPHSDWTPSGVVRFAAGVGLWDVANNRYLLPQFSADATHPGGAGTLQAPSAFFNVAFRHNEPIPNVGDLAGTSSNPSWWRDRAQGTALAGGDISSFHDDVDFNKLAKAVTDDSMIPTTGPIDRIMASHFETKQGADYSVACGVSSACLGELRGRLQPYAIYVPKKAPPKTGYGLTLLLHSLSANYNQYLGSRNQSEFGDRGTGSLVITAEGRGPDGWYYDQAGADTFEMWADVAARYHLDPDWTAITGYSMGGYATYKLATQFPDLFAKAQPTVGPPGLGIWVPPADPTGGAQSNTFNMLDSLRNIPFLIWVEATDELVPIAGTTKQSQGFDALGYRYEFDVFTPGDHLGLAINDQFQPAADFLGTTRVDRNPAHVTYVVNPTMDFPQDGTTADHAYWLSGLHLRDGSGAAPRGRIDVRSEGFGVGDPAPSGTQPGAGVLTGGNIPAIAYASTRQSWGSLPATPVADTLDITATNIATVVVDPRRAHVDCNAKLNITSDGPVKVTLAGCGGAQGRLVAEALPGGLLIGIPDTAAPAASPGWPLLGLPLLALLLRRRRGEAQRSRGSGSSVPMP
jgi:hypothetical protein